MQVVLSLDSLPTWSYSAQKLTIHCKRGVARGLNVLRMQQSLHSMHTFAYGEKGYCTLPEYYMHLLAP